MRPDLVTRPESTAKADVRGGQPPTTRAFPAPPEIASIMGVPFHQLDQRTLIEIVMESVRARNGGWITPVNLDVLRQFTEDHESRELTLAATHRVADGLPIVWASRLAGKPVPERVPGSDLVLSLPEAAAKAGASVFLLGGNPGVAAAAAGRLRARYPGLQSVESYCPPFGFEDDPQELDKMMEALRSARPALVLVGLGFPKQEKLISWLRYELPQAWFMGVGISLSFLAGEQPRAPLVLQRLGLEWMHRLLHEPRRLFRRYVVQGLPFGLRLFAWAVAHRVVQGSENDGLGNYCLIGHRNKAMEPYPRWPELKAPWEICQCKSCKERRSEV